MSPEVWRRFTASSLFWPVVALVALLVFDAVAVPGFFSLRIQDGHLYGSLVDILKNGTPTAIIALGMTLVIATRGIDLSVGAIVAISAAVACGWIAAAPDPTSASAAIVGMLLALGLSVVLGLWNGFLVAVLGIQPIIATLVLMTAGRGIAQLITDGQIITVANPLYAQLGGGFLLGLPVSVVLAAVLFALVGAVTRRTALGMLIEAVGINPTAARLAGIRARGITVAVYVFVDGDPYGISNIYRTFKVGSGNAAHINEFFCVPQARFLGITPQDIIDYKLPTHPLKDVDVKRAKDAIKNDPFFQHHKPWAKAMEQLVTMGVRAEQQALAAHGLNYVIDNYLPEKIAHPERFLP